VVHEEIRNWLTQLRGGAAQDEAVIGSMRSFGLERLIPYLREMLGAPDPELRCQAALAIFYVAPIDGLDLLLGLFDDVESVVRWHTCGLLHDIGDQRAIEPLIYLMKTDPDRQVRNTAAYALGGIGDARAIPALIETMDNDHEFDELGHSASSCAATALDDIMKSNYTRVKLSGDLCTMSRKTPDLAVLKSLAMELFRNR
jgi:HEAT repeat protein